MQCRHGVEILKSTSCKPCYLMAYRKKNGRKDQGTRRGLYVRPYEAEGAMTFAEIGRRLGCSKVAVQMSYNRAIHKLRRKPQSLNLLRSLIAEKEKHQPIPIHEQFQNWVSQ